MPQAGLKKSSVSGRLDNFTRSVVISYIYFKKSPRSLSKTSGAYLETSPCFGRGKVFNLHHHQSSGEDFAINLKPQHIKAWFEGADVEHRFAAGE